MFDISIIIVSWNARDFLRQCLVSIDATKGDLVREVIVVDNGSTDSSADLVARDFPHVQLIRSSRNLGFAGANNIGIRAARGEFLALINSDVIVHPRCLERLRTHLRNFMDVGVVGPKIFDRDGYVQRTCREFPNVWNTTCRSLALDTLLPKWRVFSGDEMRHWSQDTLREVDVLSGCFWMARAASVGAVGGLDERFFFYAEDVDWCKRFWENGWKAAFVPQATSTHFGGGSSSHAPLHYRIEMLRANALYWRKHHGLAGLLAFWTLSLMHHSVRFIALTFCRAVKPDRYSEVSQNWRRSMVCLRWLLTGRRVSSESS